MPADRPGLFTIGHSNQALDDFLDLLQQHRIEAVADVRTVPRSRYVPHFSAGPLREALAGRGISYIPMGRELGGRPEGDEFYDGEGHVLYGRLAATPAFRGGLGQVLAGAQTSRIALLCSEEDPGRCHRHLLIGRVLRARGVPVSHIRRGGRVETEAELAIRAAGAGPAARDQPAGHAVRRQHGLGRHRLRPGHGLRGSRRAGRAMEIPGAHSPEKTTPRLCARLSTARRITPGRGVQPACIGRVRAGPGLGAHRVHQP